MTEDTLSIEVSMDDDVEEALARYLHAQAATIEQSNEMMEEMTGQFPRVLEQVLGALGMPEAGLDIEGVDLEEVARRSYPEEDREDIPDFFQQGDPPDPEDVPIGPLDEEE